MAQQNTSDGTCCSIYSDESDENGHNIHIKRRNGQEKILGSKGQFCAAFYHVECSTKCDEERTREYFCLDDTACIIGQGRDEEDNVNSVVAVVKFENRGGQILYEARYTNCKNDQKHAEDFFKDDIEDGELARKVEGEENGTITMYLTLQPCNKSTSPRGTEGTPADKTCCKTLKYIFKKILQHNHKEIGLCVKVAHTNHLGPGPENDDMHAQLRENAKTGIKKLKKSGVSVERMTDVDWEYLFDLTSASLPPRNDLDSTVGKILTDLEI